MPGLGVCLCPFTNGSERGCQIHTARAASANPSPAHRTGVLDGLCPDGYTLVTASDDGTVILWDLTGLNYLLHHVVERACAMAPGGLGREEWDR
ncbi:MAG: hypothetical protein ACRDTC_05250 [Pseudonocardiaceae bacterium]